jgi:hypothetical protein
MFVREEGMWKWVVHMTGRRLVDDQCDTILLRRLLVDLHRLLADFHATFT